MTTKTDIKLPPLPVWMSRYVVPADDFESGRDRLLDDLMEEYARAAVVADRKTRWVKERAQLEAEWSGLQQMKGAYEADRQGLVPSDDELLKWAGEEQFFLFCDEDEFLQIAREVLFRYGSSQPAISDMQLHCILQVYDDALDKAREGREFDNPGRPGSLEARAWDAGTRRGKELGPITQPAAEAVLRKILQVVQRYLPPDGPSVEDAMGQIIALVDPWPLSGQPAASAEPHRCEDCPPVGYPTDETRCAPCDRSAAPVAQEPSESAVLLDALSGLVNVLRERHYGRMPDEVQAAYDKASAIVFSSPVAAPVAQEPPQVTDAEIEQIVTGAGARWDGLVWKVEDADLHPMARALLYRYTTAPVAVQPVVTDEMVTRFLGWHLPQDFAPDAGISFSPSPDPHSWPVGTNLLTDPQARAMLEYVLQGAPATAQAQHPDDAAVDAFAAAMKAKLAQKRAEGRGGWEDKTQCSQDRLSLMLRGHVAKGDPVDVANFAMMLHQRGERISGRDAASPSAQDREDAQRYRLVRGGRYWDVIDGVGNTLQSDDLDAAVDTVRSRL